MLTGVLMSAYADGSVTVVLILDDDLINCLISLLVGPTGKKHTNVG